MTGTAVTESIKYIANQHHTSATKTSGHQAWSIKSMQTVRATAAVLYPVSRGIGEAMTNSGEGLASDEQLAQVIRNREQSGVAMQDATDCFEQLYERHSRLLLAFLSSRVVRSDLEDVHQTVWQKIWQYLPGQFQGGNFRAWMHQIARNHLIDLSRKRRPEEMTDGPEPVALGHDAEDPLEDAERQEILMRCLDRLQEDMGEIVRSRLSGEDYNGICARMGIEAARAHKLFFQAREQVTSCVQKALQ